MTIMAPVTQTPVGENSFRKNDFRDPPLPVAGRCGDAAWARRCLFFFLTITCRVFVYGLSGLGENKGPTLEFGEKARVNKIACVPSARAISLNSCIDPFSLTLGLIVR